MSNLLTQQVLGLPKPSILERYSNISFVFTLSGIMHVINCIGATESEPLGTMFFFQSFGILIMIEDAGQALWRRWSKAPVGDDGQVAVWQKAVGYAWVSAVMILLTPWLQYSAARLPADKAGAVPYGITERIGVKWACVGIGIGGVLSLALLKPEI